MVKSFKKMALVAVLGFATSTAQAGLVTYKSTGILTDGYDGLNIFGLGENLKGQTFTQTLTIELDGLENIYQEPGYDWRYDYSHTILGSATVGDVTYSWKGTNAAAEVIISNLLTSGKPKGIDQLSLSTLGKNLLDPAVIIEGTTSISSFRTPFMQDSDFLKPHIFGAELGGVFANSYFSAFQIGNSGQSYYVGTVTSASWTVDQSVSPVPEPGTYGIFLLGVGFIGLALRKRGIANV